MTESRRCPSCGRDDVDRILYGLFDPPTRENPMEHVRFGGCMVMAGLPNYHCNSCGHRGVIPSIQSGDALADRS